MIGLRRSPNVPFFANEADALVVSRLQERRIIADAVAAVDGVQRVGSHPHGCGPYWLAGCDLAIFA